MNKKAPVCHSTYPHESLKPKINQAAHKVPPKIIEVILTYISFVTLSPSTYHRAKYKLHNK